jgi:uncharacterized protein YicC (UPF0701 family)
MTDTERADEIAHKWYADLAEAVRDTCAAIRAEISAEIDHLRQRIAELESELQLTDDRKELRRLLDVCGLDFERMRERANAAEARLAQTRVTIEIAMDALQAALAEGSGLDRIMGQLECAVACCDGELPASDTGTD